MIIPFKQKHVERQSLGPWERMDPTGQMRHAPYSLGQWLELAAGQMTVVGPILECKYSNLEHLVYNAQLSWVLCGFEEKSYF